MSFNYTPISNTVNSLIASFGKDITISRITSGVFDPATGEETATDTTSQTVKAVVLPASGGKVQALDIRYKLGTLTFTRLNYFQISGQDLTFTPKPDDSALIQGEIWTVIGVTPLNPNSGSPILWEVAIRI